MRSKYLRLKTNTVPTFKKKILALFSVAATVRSCKLFFKNVLTCIFLQQLLFSDLTYCISGHFG